MYAGLGSIVLMSTVPMLADSKYNIESSIRILNMVNSISPINAVEQQMAAPLYLPFRSSSGEVPYRRDTGQKSDMICQSHTMGVWFLGRKNIERALTKEQYGQSLFLQYLVSTWDGGKQTIINRLIGAQNPNIALTAAADTAYTMSGKIISGYSKTQQHIISERNGELRRSVRTKSDKSILLNLIRQYRQEPSAYAIRPLARIFDSDRLRLPNCYFERSQEMRNQHQFVGQCRDTLYERKP